MTVNKKQLEDLYGGPEGVSAEMKRRRGDNKPAGGLKYASPEKRAEVMAKVRAGKNENKNRPR